MKGLRHVLEKLRELYKTRQDNMPLARLIARIEAHLEESQIMYHDARHLVRDLTGDEDF